MLVLVPVVGLPIAATGYVLKLRGLQAIVEEKRVHLQGVDALLAQYLQDRAATGAAGRATAALRGPGRADPLSRPAAVRVHRPGGGGLSGVGVGYFHLGLNAIITYGPSGQYRQNRRACPSPRAPGLAGHGRGTAMTVSGGQVRGNIMNAMLPIKDRGQVVGYIWANELLDAIDRRPRP